ncbi:hypothetical protein Lal_00041234 [Lupinus albus]|nr:hypothetical protein Lal_00041234 [Lupinus albus]
MNEGTTLAIVEDDPEIRALLGGFLEGEGFRVESLDGGAALDRRLAQGPPPDLIVLDWMLPGEDGPVDLPAPARERRAARGDAHRQGRGHRQGPRPGNGRGRLRLEAVQPPRAAGPHPGGAAADARRGRRRGGSGGGEAAGGRPRDRPRRPLGPRGGGGRRAPRSHPHQRRVRPADVLRHAAAAGAVAGSVARLDPGPRRGRVRPDHRRAGQPPAQAARRGRQRTARPDQDGAQRRLHPRRPRPPGLSAC